MEVDLEIITTIPVEIEDEEKPAHMAAEAA